MPAAHKSSAEAGLKPISRWAVAFGIVGFFAGTTLWFLVPSQFTHHIKGCVFVPMAAFGAISCGVGILVSWKRIGWLLRLLGILMVVVGVAPLALIASAVIKGLMNWPTPEQLELKQR